MVIEYNTDSALFDADTIAVPSLGPSLSSFTSQDDAVGLEFFRTNDINAAVCDATGKTWKALANGGGRNETNEEVT